MPGSRIALEVGGTGWTDRLIGNVERGLERMIRRQTIEYLIESFLQIVLEVFNAILKGDGEIPETWRHTELLVIFKKGDPALPSNYRPISLLPMLYKLFS